MREFRRESPRIGIEALCWELVADREVSGLAVELSSHGLRIERPYTGGPTRREVPLQIEVPGIDEVMWARADACFDQVVPATGPAGGALGLVRRTGYRITAAAARDLRLIEELVIETDRVRRREQFAKEIDADFARVTGAFAARGTPVDPARVSAAVAGPRDSSIAFDLGRASCYLRA